MRRFRNHAVWNLAISSGLALLLALMASARADLQFDVFIGYGSSGGNDGLVRAGTWFPVACEVYNDGPTFNAVFELTSSSFGGDTTHTYHLELPTHTRKRFVFPIFGASQFASWNARLLDSRGRVRAEHSSLGINAMDWDAFLLGAIPDSFGGLPTFPKVRTAYASYLPQVARMEVAQFPDDPIALEGLSALYLNTDKAIALSSTQVAALLAWVHAGGHLIVAPQQLQDIDSTPWLKNLLPITLGSTLTNLSTRVINDWLHAGRNITPGNANGAAGFTISRGAPGRSFYPSQPYNSSGNQNTYDSLAPELAFQQADFPVFAGQAREGQTSLSSGNWPLIVSTPCGRGEVTELAFNPEREPFKSWKHKAWFWARLCHLPASLFRKNASGIYGGWSTDGVFGAMLDSRQVHKLPVEWLLALLVVYLLVIGPFDQYVLRKLNRQMLTWLTFPAYVVLFSLLIYWIGYKLRAGATEWNELQVIDVLPRAQQAVLRGHTYASLYSSKNASYRLGSSQPDAALRGEYVGTMRGGTQQGGRVNVEVKANAFTATVAVPVWTGLLYVSDWEEPANRPLNATLVRENGRLRLTVRNDLPGPISDVRFVYDGQMYSIGPFAGGQSKTQTLTPNAGRSLVDFERANSSRFQSAVRSRRRLFGNASLGHLNLTPDNLAALSFLSQSGNVAGSQRQFTWPPGLELSPLLQRGDGILLAWYPGHSLSTSPLHQFKAIRSTVNTYLRLDVPLSPAPTTGS